MNTNKKPLGIVARARKTLLGRVLCRIAGEESGQTMMEYVIIATLIAAACAVGVWIFGRQILHGADSAGSAVIGDDVQSQQTIEDAKSNHDGEIQASDTASKGHITADDETTADIK